MSDEVQSAHLVIDAERREIVKRVERLRSNLARAEVELELIDRIRGRLPSVSAKSVTVSPPGATLRLAKPGDPQVILRDQNGLKLIEMKRAMDRVLVDAGPKGLSSREIAESIEALEESVIDATVSPKTVSNYLRRYGEAMDWHKFGPSPRYTRWRKGQLVQMSAHLGAGATTENPSEGEGGPS